MKTKLLVLITLVLLGTKGWSQNLSTQLFKIFPGSDKIDVKNDIRNAVFLEIDFNELSRIYEAKSSLLSLTIPASGNSLVTFDLRDSRVLSDNFSVRTGNHEKVNYTPGIYYQGTVSGINPSLAAWSMFDNSIMAVFSYNHENYILGVWNDKSNTNKNIYILYKDRDVLYARDFNCGTDLLPERTRANNNNNGHLQSNQCIKIYFECEYQMFVDKGSAVNVVNYVTGMFNVIQALYNVEVINTEISEIYVWTTTDPYVSFTTSGDLLNNFQSTRTSFNGNLAHLLTTKNSSAGGMAYLDVICDPPNAYGVSNIDNTYDPYPNYCWTSEVVTHELGHNFGSKHTHWCGWTGGAIDDCYATEGGCSPGPTPTNSGTIMSYCHLSGTGILLTNGFGTQPGNAIRAAYAAASCLTPCASPPDAAFTGTPLNSCTAPITVTFTDQTVGYTSSWAWDIDSDGVTDYTTESPTHTYTSTGIYTVTLIVTNTNGSDTLIKTSYIAVGSVTPSVTTAITTGSTSICGGTPVTFTATPVNGGPTPSYQWNLNGVAISGATSSTYTTTTVGNNDVITCTITSNAPCASPATATSTGTTMSVTPSVIPTINVAITSGSATICVGATLTFSATSTNDGNTPVYQWQVNGTDAGTNSTTFSPPTLANGDVISCILTSDAVCANPVTITSSIVTITVNPIVSPTVSVAISSGTNPTCLGVPITFSATSTDGGLVPVYQWQLNGVNAIIGTSYTPSALANSDVVTCVLTSNANCISTNTATSTGTTISIIPSPTPGISVALTSGTNPSCFGSSATFTATATNAGTTPTYQWYLNGNAITGAQSITYTPPTLTDGSEYSCEVVSSAACPGTFTSTPIIVEVPPVASITFISNMDVCGGEIAETVFSSNPTGADYTWTNSNTAIGLGSGGTGNIPSFIAVNTTAASITSTITVTPSMSGCPGTPSTYTILVNPTPEITYTGGILSSTPASTYQWYVDGQPIGGATNQTCTITQNGDYSVVVDTGSCPSASITITTAGIAQFNTDCFLAVYPNPNDGNFTISFEVPERSTYTLKVVNVIGALIYNEVLTDFDGKYSKQMNFGRLAKGVYLISLTGSESELVKKVVVY